MATVYTRRFVAHFEASLNFRTLWTPSTDWVWIIRDIVVNNQLATTQRGQVWIQAGANAFSLIAADIPGYGSVHWDGRQEILPLEELHGGCAAGPWSVLVTGYALTPEANPVR